MDIVNDEFFLELEKDYEYGRSHIRVLWNLLLENFSFIENDELGAYVLEQIVEYRNSPVYDKMEKDYLSDEREKDAYKFVYKKNHEKNYYV